MKKLAMILGLSGLLTACFDEPKKPEPSAAETTKVAAEASSAEEKNVTQTTEAHQADPLNKAEDTSAKHDATASTEMTASKAQTADAKSNSAQAMETPATPATPTTTSVEMNKPAENRPTANNAEVKQNVTPKTALKTSESGLQAVNQVSVSTNPATSTSRAASTVSHQKAVADAKPPKAEAPKSEKALDKALTHTKVKNGTENGLSPEEQRVGAQEAIHLTDDDIRQLKVKCRYPFMSEQEIADYHCQILPVSISK